MVGEVVNLNKARKKRVRAQATERAAANRVRFGRTRGEKEVEQAEATRAERRLDGKVREPDGG